MKRNGLFLGMIMILLSNLLFAQDKPNILIIHTDEHNFKTISKYRELDMHSGDLTNEEYYNPWNATDVVTTPNMDRIGTEGAVSTKHYVTSPTCTPSRASLMTSMYPGSTGAARNDRPMNEDIKTFAHVLKDNGYSTSYVGKWHLEGKDDPANQVWGAGRNFGFDNIEWRIEKEHWTWYNEDGVPPYDWGEQGKPNGEWIYATEFYTNKAIEIMDKDISEDKPFCLLVSIPDPHTPNHSAPEYQDWCRNVNFTAPYTYDLTYDTEGVRPNWADKENNNDVHPHSHRYSEFDEFYMQEYWGMVKAVDDNIGRMFDLLEEKGQLDNTIIVYTVDHGDMLFEYSRINKGVPYESSAKVPFMIRYPKKIPSGKVVTTPHVNVDVGPTLLSLAGLPTMEDVHGQDISRLYTSEELMVTEEDTVFITEDAGWWVSAATTRFKLVLSNKDNPYLIDLKVDPLETTNQLVDTEGENYAMYREKALELEASLKHKMIQKNELYGAGIKFLIWMTTGPVIPDPPAVEVSDLPLNKDLFGFEGTAVVDGTAKRWSMGASNDFSITDEKAATGNSSLRFYHTSALTGNGGAAHAPAGMVKLAAGKFTFKAKVFIEEGSAANRFRLFLKNPNNTLDPFTLPSTTGSWVDVSYDFTMDQGTSDEGTFSIVIQPGDATNNGGTFSDVYFDDIEIVENIPLPYLGLDPVLFGFEGSQLIDNEEKNWTIGSNGAAYSQEEKASGNRSLNMSNVSLVNALTSSAVHSPIKSIYMNEGDYELSLKVKAKENNKIKQFDIILKDNKQQSLFIQNTFDISSVTESDGWVTLKKTFTFNKESDPNNGQMTIRIREVDLNPEGEGFLFLDDIRLVKVQNDNGGGTDPADETPLDIANAPEDLNYINSHLFGFEGPTLIDLGSGKVRVRWTGDSSFGIVNINGAPHGHRVMRFKNEGTLPKNQSVYVDKNSANLPTDRDVEFSMKVFIEEGSTVQKIRVTDLTSPIMQFDVSGVERNKWVTLKSIISPDNHNASKRVKLQIQPVEAGDNNIIYFDEVRVADVMEEVAGGCMNNEKSLINTCDFGFEQNTADWASNAIYSVTDEMAWGGSSALKVQIDEEITSGNLNHTPKTAIMPNVTINEENVVVNFRMYIDGASTLSQFLLLAKFDGNTPQTFTLPLTDIIRDKWVSINATFTVKDFDTSSVLNWIGFRFNSSTEGTGTIYFDDVKAVVQSEYVADGLRDVTFTVKDTQGNPIEDALVSVEGFIGGSTDSNGQVVVKSSNINGKSFTVSKTGYNTVASSYTVFNEDIAVDVVLPIFVPERYAYTLMIKDENGQPLSGVDVVDNTTDQVYTSDVRGAVVFTGLLENDVIDYSINHEGFSAEANQVTIGVEDVVNTVTLVKQLLAPIADFTANRTEGDDPLTVSFTDKSTNDPTSWLWTFGDGTTSDEQHPFHTYQEAGVYTVTLKAMNETGEDEASMEDYISAGLFPVAGFETDQTTVDLGTAIQFTDTSTGSPTSWLWNFGDESTSVEQHPSHTYENAGTYSIKLTVGNEDGEDLIMMLDYITVNEIPEVTAGFEFAVDNASSKTYHFTDISSGNPTSWLWTFGDGTTSDEQNPSHTYANAGEYKVMLQVENENGTSSSEETIVVTALTFSDVYANDFEEFDEAESLLDDARAEDRKFHYIAFQQAELARTLTTVVEGENKFMRYGDSETTASANGQIRTNTVISFVAGKKYQLTMRTRGLAIHFPLIMDTETNSPRFRGDQINIGNATDWYTHTLEFETTEDFDATIAIGRNWYGILDIDDISLVEVEEEVEQPEALNAAITVSSTSVMINEAVQFTDATTGNPTGWTWDFGDDQFSTEQNPTHTYTTKGEYTVTLTVLNDASSSSSATVKILVSEESVVVTAPVAAFSVSETNIEENESVQFTDASSDATSWAWDFGDGETSSEQNPTHTYTTAGTYSVKLTVTNEAGSSTETKTDLIQVANTTPTSVALEEAGIKLFPNPTTEEVNIVSSKVVKVSIYNISGQKMKSLDKNDESMTISVRDLNKGMYIFMLSTKDGRRITTKVQVK
ncbi:PKD domain-containing protein [Flammeovirga agarivorans]|uniref:PKD domain-containing protein n=1 Tax=Flammeovirga agarivorans TaxID=2726742 RepID=A0A7X8SND3_9BACT|nr:PKD domain-containing protein [Flammeovirga agarivorans]NLR93399.1 PKD domain-containing protein [Flammeovirga agarivorans]